MFSSLLPTENDIQAAEARLHRLADEPLFIYGAGGYAEELEAFLHTKAIQIQGRFIDDAFREGRGLDGILRLEDIIERFPRFNVLIGHFGEPDTAARKIKSRAGDRANTVTHVDFRFWRSFGGFTLSHLNANLDRFEAVYNKLHDERSRRTFVAYLKAKLTFDSTELSRLRSEPQYFPKDLPDFRPFNEDVVIDGGAYTGDTLSEILALLPGHRCRRYHAFEPDEVNVKQLQKLIGEEALDFVEVHKAGLWHEKTTLSFDSNETTSSSSISQTGACRIAAETVDETCCDATLIKLDIEGAEIAALEGARDNIVNNKPRIAAAMYHKPDDLTGIPELLISMRDDYMLDLRIHTHETIELVLYAR